MPNYYLAVDIGASSGRHIVGWTEHGELKTQEVYRFPNGVERVDGHLTWNTTALTERVKTGIAIAKATFGQIESAGVAAGNKATDGTRIQST